jgi:ATP phosphoribosyltransferase
LKAGSVHLGITGEDLIRENISDADTRIGFLHKLGFGFADVVVAVPACWIDVATVADLEDIAMPFRRTHGRWPRVATKYMNLTRRFFASKGYGDYRIIESAGATEGAPAAGTAELIVDITTTGETLRANGLRILDDGVILKSQANLFASNVAAWTPELRSVCDRIVETLAKSLPASERR